MRAASVLAAMALSLLVMCSEKVEDGDSCENDGECSSGRCVAGLCDGADCTCEGPTCRGRSSCRSGWLCVRGDATSEGVLPRCRQECAGVGTCPSGKRCDNGVCRAGAEPFVLTWLNIPRPLPCAAKVPCEYKAKPSEGVTVDTYTWTFGTAPPVETKEPTTSFTYPVGGSHEVLVRARSTAGAIAELRTTEVLCAGGIGDDCDPGGTPCCEGGCTTAGLCK